MYKFLILAAAVAVANAGLPAYGAYGYASPYAYGAVAAPAITSQSANTLRSYGNLGQVSTYHKTIDTPYSSVRKSDVRVSNDALAYHAPAVAAYHAPTVAYGAPALRAYGAPAYAYGAPALRAYGAPALRAYGAPGYAYGAPAIRTAVAAPAGLIGTAYSAAPAVAHLSFNGLGINYAY